MNEMIRATLLTLLEAGIQQIIRLDTQLQQKVAQLAGKQIGIEISDKQLSLLLIPTERGLLLQQADLSNADATISGQSDAFIAMIRSKDKLDLMFGHGIRVSGDLATIRQFQQLIDSSKPDIEAILSNLFGDLAAHQMVSSANSLHHQMSLMKNSLTQNSMEYLTEELRILPTQIEYQPFVEECERAREQCDRLAARIDRLAAK